MGPQFNEEEKNIGDRQQAERRDSLLRTIWQRCVFTESRHRSLPEPSEAKGPRQHQELGLEGATQEGISSVRFQVVQRPRSTPEESSHLPQDGVTFPGASHSPSVRTTPLRRKAFCPFPFIPLPRCPVQMVWGGCHWQLMEPCLQGMGYSLGSPSCRHPSQVTLERSSGDLQWWPQHSPLLMSLLLPTVLSQRLLRGWWK